jgi:hypothetical protein
MRIFTRQPRNNGWVRRGASGQALVETAIVLPTMILVGLGAFQLMFIQHARVLTEYAAYNACRAGIVHNGDPDVMTNAALISVLPVYGPTNDVPSLLLTYAKTKFLSVVSGGLDQMVNGISDLLRDITGLPVNLSELVVDVSLINVLVLNPAPISFIDASGSQKEEIDFDDVLDPFHAEKNVLVIETRILVPLKIPIINKVIYNLWLAKILLQHPVLRTDLIDQVAYKTKLQGGQDLEAAIKEHIHDPRGITPEDLRLWQQLQLMDLAAGQGVYLMPVYAKHAMQMQSNMFLNNASRQLISIGGH